MDGVVLTDRMSPPPPSIDRSMDENDGSADKSTSLRCRMAKTAVARLVRSLSPVGRAGGGIALFLWGRFRDPAFARLQSCGTRAWPARSYSASVRVALRAIYRAIYPKHPHPAMDATRRHRIMIYRDVRMPPVCYAMLRHVPIAHVERLIVPVRSSRSCSVVLHQCLQLCELVFINHRLGRLFHRLSGSFKGRAIDGVLLQAIARQAPGAQRAVERCAD